uniref:Ankyrin-2 n=1 Tax=Macrostomum lignano TaxID=282301 RepID=A0A1I8GR71_9PLAT
MNGSRFPGLRIVIPPNAASAPTRITCRLMRQGRVSRPPQFNDGEGLACRVIEMGPSNATFNSNVLIEVPHFASMRDREREIVVLRSDNGETWKEHTVEVTEQSVIDAVGGAFGSMPTNDDLRKKRIVRILTNSFPQYFALVTRIRQESALIGPEGGVISSTVIGQVQAVFPESALTKKIRVGIQALPVPTEQVNRLLGNRVAVSPVVTIEPRRRKFHKPITLTIPLPKPATRGITNPGESPTLRLLCSITGGVQPATWEDITGSTPLSYVKDCVSFTTTVSARFWLMDCPNTTESADMAGKLYRDAFLVPYMGRFVIFAKRTEQEEAKLRCFCITDDKVDKTLECNEGFERKAESREVEVLDSKPQWIEGVGNLTPTSKNGDQLFLPFRAFKENRLAFPVKIKDPNEPAIGKIAFLKDPRPTKPTDSPSLKPICTLEVQLPDYVSDGSSPKPDKSAADQPELLSFTTDRIARSELDLRDLADCVRADWPMLARELGVGQSDITNAKRERGPEATGNDMERALRRIGRDDVVKKCMRNVEYVVGEDEKRQAKSLLDKQEAEDRHSGSNRSSQPPLEDVADDEAGAGDFVKPSVDERHGPPPPAKSEAEQAKEREVKSEAFLSLIDSMNSMTPEPEVHLPASDMEGQEAVQEEDIAAISREPAVEDPAAVEELLGKLDSLPAMSMAPEGDEEVDTPQAAPVSHTAPSQRDTPPPSPAERADDADDESRLKEEARQFAEGVMERQDDLQRHEQEREDLDNQQEGTQDDAPVEAIQLQQPLVEASPQSVPEVEPESKLESRKQPEAQPEAQPELEPEAEPEVEQEVQPEIEPEAQPEVEQEVQPEVEQEAQPEVEPEAEPEVEQEEPKPAQTVSSVPENEANPDEASAAMASAAGQDDEAETQPAEEDEQQQQQQGGKKKRRNKKKK